jgi:alpha-2-macroglobulin
MSKTILKARSRWNILVIYLCSLHFLQAAEPPPTTKTAEAEAFRAAREALADQDYKTAVERLEAFRSQFPDSPLAEDGEILIARARQLAGSPEAALASLQKFVERRPDSPFAAKARLLMAEAYISLKRFADAASIYRTRLEFLRGDAYRDRIAGYYLEIADPAYQGRPVQDPSTLVPRQILQHDYAAALEFYGKALSAMGPAGKLRAERGDEIRFRIGRSLIELDRAGEAIVELAALLADARPPRAALSPALLGEALFALGQAQLKGGALEDALASLSRIENELGDHPRAAEALQSILAIEVQRASSLSDEKEKKAAVERARAAFARFEKKFPQSPVAPQVTFDFAEALARWGDRAGAIERFRDLIARFPKDERAPTAQLRVAELLREDHQYDAAVAEWKKFLGTYASDPRWSEAQEKIEGALYEKGLWLLREKKKPEEARAAWEQFIAERPASPLVPEIYRRYHEMALEAKKHAEAADALRRIVEKYPQSPLAPSSALLLAQLLQGPLDDFEGAVKAYEALAARFPQSAEAGQAQAALQEMRSKHLALSAPRVYTSGEPWTLKVETRNIPKLKLKAYRVNLEEYFRKKLALAGLEEVAVGVVEPSKTWELEVGIDEKGGYRPYKTFSGEKKLPLPESEVGAYIVTAEEDEYQAVVLALRSDLQVVAKSSPRETFLWAFDERSGKPLEGVRVLLAGPGGVFFEGKTATDGVLQVPHQEPRPDVRILAVRSAGAEGSFHYAVNAAASPAEVAYGYTTKIHVTTDRPLYRPEQTVHFRAILRKVVEGRYQSSEGEKADVTVTNPLGVILYQESLKANEFGAISGSLELTDEPPLGDYTVAVSYGGQASSGKFKVEEYRKPEFQVGLKTERPAYLRGEEMKGKITAEYLFGGPVKKATVSWQVFEGPYAFDASRFDENRWFFAPRPPPGTAPKPVASFKLVAEGSGETDDRGEVPFSYKPQADGHDHTYRVRIEATDLSRVTVAGSEDVLSTSQEIYVVARADRKVYRPGDRVTVSFRTVDAASRPVDSSGEAVLARRVRGESPGEVFDREVEKSALSTAQGKGEVSVSPKEPGEYRVIFRTRDRGGNLCEGGVVVRVAGDEPDLAREARLLFEKAVYHQGEEARLFLNTPVTGRPALLTFEGDRVISYRLIEPGERSFEIKQSMESRFSPNITAAVAIPSGGKLLESRDEAVVLQYLDVEVKSDKPEYRPGDEAAIEVTARDQGGQPKEAEFSLAVIDASILQLQPDLVEPVKPFFYDQRRAHAVSTGSSYSFAYPGVTTRKPEELVALEKLQELKTFESARVAQLPEGVTVNLARSEVTLAGLPPPMAPAAAAPVAERARAAKAGAVSGGFGQGGGRGMSLRRAAGEKGAALADGADKEAAKADEKESLDLPLETLGAEGLMEERGGGELEVGPGAPPLVEPTIRRHFADTAVWKSDVRTGKDGKARVTFKVPDNLTGWRAAAIGATRAAEETLVGDGEARFRSKKGLLLRIQAPRFLTREDAASLTTPVHNYLPEAVDVTLEMIGKDLDARSFSKTTLKVGSGDALAADWEIAPRPVRQGTLTARALSAKESDAIEQSIPIIPFGKRTRGGEGGLLSDEALIKFPVAEALIEGAGGARVEVSPRFSGDLRRAVLFLRAFPYGCVEQTVSGFVAAVAVNQALEKLATPDQDLRNLLQDLVPRRIVKILNAQRTSGGWGWWGQGDLSPELIRAGDHSDPRMTGLALLGLERARLAGFRVQEDRLEKARTRTATFLKAAALDDVGGLVAYALSFSKKAAPEELNRLYRGRESAASAALALLGLAFEGQGQRVQATEMARLLKSRAKDLILNGRVAGAYFPVKTGRENPPDSVIATSYGLMLLDRLEPEGALAPRLYEGLFALRTGIHWQTTEATAAAVVALAGHAEMEAKSAAEAEVTVELNGETFKTLRIAAARPGDETQVVEIPQEKLKAGENRIQLRKSGSGRLGYAVSYEYFTPADRIAEEGNLLKIHRQYIAYVPPRPEPAPNEGSPPDSSVPKPQAPSPKPEAEDLDGLSSTDPPTKIAGPDAGWLLAKEPPPPGFRVIEASKRPQVKPKTVEKTVSGDKFRVTLTIEAREPLDYVLIEDPIPAGCEVIDDPQRFEGSYDRREVRDQRVVFFRSKLPAGSHVLSYLLRPTFPGRYRALPAVASLMYEPGIVGQSSDHRLTILRPEAREPQPPPELTADEKLYQAERQFRTLIDGEKGEGRAARLADLRQLYLDLISSNPLSDQYQDLALSRIVGIDLRAGPAERAVRGFEEVRRRNPRLIQGEEDHWLAAGAYGAERENQAEVTLLRGIFERRYRVDRAVSETFSALGQPLRAQAYGFEVLAYYPDSPPIVNEWFELSRRYAALTVKENDPRTGRPRERAMFRESVESLREFVAHFPSSAFAPQATSAVLDALESLQDFAAERREAEAFERRYPKSPLLDGALMKALEADFRLGKFQKVLEEAPRIIGGEFLKPDGKFGPSEHADGALYLMAKARHVLGQIPEAIEAYSKLAGKIPDAKEALLYLTAREVSSPPVVESPTAEKPELEITHRNVEKVRLRVYRVDLPVLFAVRKDLRGVSAVNLTGIDPVKSWEEKLPGGSTPRKTRIALPADEKGAYLVVGRAEDPPSGANLAASGGNVKLVEFSTIVLRSDLQIDLQRLPGKVRVNVFKRTPGGGRVPQAGATVRVSDGQRIAGTGPTDARGVFEAAIGGRGRAIVLAEFEGNFALAE